LSSDEYLSPPLPTPKHPTHFGKPGTVNNFSLTGCFYQRGFSYPHGETKSGSCSSAVFFFLVTPCVFLLFFFFSVLHDFSRFRPFPLFPMGYQTSPRLRAFFFPSSSFPPPVRLSHLLTPIRHPPPLRLMFFLLTPSVFFIFDVAWALFLSPPFARSRVLQGKFFDYLF